MCRLFQNLLPYALPLAAALCAMAQEGMPRAFVETVPAEERQVRRLETFTGSVEPQTRSAVAAEIEGLVEKVAVEEGDFVQKGQLLVQLKDGTTRLALAHAESSLAEAQARAGKAVSELERARVLHEQGFLSDNDLLDKQTEARALEEKAKQWQIAIIGYKGDLEKYRIRAPFAGMVARTLVQPGEWVSEGGKAAELLDLGTVHLTVNVPERHISAVKPGESVQVRVDAFANETFEGRVFAVLPQASGQARSFPVKVAVKNPQMRLRGGMFARADFAIGESYRALLVPKDALVRQGGGFVVFTVEGGKALAVEVRLGDAFGELVAVQGGLKAGAAVAVRGNERLFTGQPVEVMPARKASAPSPPAS